MQTGSRLLRSAPKANFYPKLSFLMPKITQTKYFALNFNILRFLGCSRQQNHLHFVALACTGDNSSTKTMINLSSYPTSIPETFQAALDLQQQESQARMVQKCSAH